MEYKIEEWLTDDGLKKIEKWARDGLSKPQIAENMGIALRTLYNWEKAHLPICKALDAGRKKANEHVENALFKRANGYDWIEKTEQETKDGTFTKTVLKHVPPDVRAIEYWLKTKAPSIWGKKEKLELEKLKAEIERLQAGLNPELDDEKGSNLLEALKELFND